MHQETYEQQPRYVRVQGTFLLPSLNNQNRCFNSSSLHHLLVLYWCIYATMVIYIHNHRARTAHNIPIAVQDEWKWVARIRWCVKAETFHEKWQDWRWKDLRAHTHSHIHTWLWILFKHYMQILQEELWRPWGVVWAWTRLSAHSIPP